MKNTSRIYLLIGTIVIIVLWVGSWILLTNSITCPAERGQFGDMFGAINSLFSGLALSGVAYTIFLQYESSKISEYQFRFSHILDIVNQQIIIFNSRILEFKMIVAKDKIKEKSLNKGISYFKSIEDQQDKLEIFLSNNDGNISSLLRFIYDSNQFIYNLIERENFSNEDTEKLKNLYSRSLDRNIADFMHIVTKSLTLDKEKLPRYSEDIRPAFELLIKLKSDLAIGILKKKFE